MAGGREEIDSTKEMAHWSGCTILQKTHCTCVTQKGLADRLLTETGHVPVRGVPASLGSAPGGTCLLAGGW